jgi:peptidoglycan hydrolase-like protein with peptidoglycan-binding domain
VLLDNRLRHQGEVAEVMDRKRVFTKGNSSGGVAAVQDALMRAGFACFDPQGSYSSGTETTVKTFRDSFSFYFSPYSKNNGNGLVVDDEFVQRLDDALNGKLTVHFGTFGLLKGSRFIAAETCLPMTRSWIDTSLVAIEVAGQLLLNRAQLNMQHASHANILTAFYLHFRLSLLSEKFLLPAFAPFNVPTRLVKVATMADLAVIANLFAKFRKTASQSAKQIFVESPPHPTIPSALASASTGGSKIFLHPPFMPAGGRSKESIVWLTIHEMVHLHIFSNHDRSRPYTWDSDYMLLNAAQCKSNPDCFSHFATQIAKGEPQLTPAY